MSERRRYTECGAGSARPLKVTYIDDRTESLRLCKGCTSEYEDGTLVEAVEPLSSDFALGHSASGSSCQSDS